MITVKVDTRNAKPVKKELVTTGSIGIQVKFMFSADWDGLGKTAVFSDGTVTKDVVLTTNECVIPHECLVTEGALLTLGIYGTNGDDVVIPTIECPLARINQGTEPSDDPSIEPTPSAVNQILAAAQNAVEVAQSVRDDADDGLFDGEDGEDGVSPSVTITEVSGGHTVKITDKDHPLGQTFTIADGVNGTDGTDGTDGEDGYSPVVSISEIPGGHSVTITDLDHPEGQTFEVMDGQGGGASSWSDLTDKPFTTIGGNLKVVGGALTVDTAEAVEEDNTKPITSAAVYTEVGNIAALLAAI